ncbi:MAG: nucleotide-binding protein [Desulfocucumaceae bacterium]
MNNILLPGIAGIDFVVNIMYSLKRITLLTGNLGSGKTEIAINLALNLLKQEKKTILVDLDIINPYFRSRLVKGSLENMGLRVIAPEGNMIYADLPAVSPAIKGVIEDVSVNGVFDVGGDDVGAKALGRYRDLLTAENCNMLFVVNTCRPFTRDPDGIIKYITSIQAASGIKVKGLVSNPNLGRETAIETVLEGFRVVAEVSELTGLPIKLTAVRRDLEKKAREVLDQRIPLLTIDYYMKTPWELGG